MNRIKNIAFWGFIFLLGGWVLYLITGYAETKWIKVDVALSFKVEQGASQAMIVANGIPDTVFLDEQGNGHYTYRTGVKRLKEKSKIRLFSTLGTGKFTFTGVKINSLIYSAEHTGEALNDLFKFNPANVQERSLLPVITSEGLAWNLQNNPYDFISRKELLAPFFTRLFFVRLLIIILVLGAMGFCFRNQLSKLQPKVAQGSLIVIGFILISVFFIFSERTNASHEKRKLAEFPTWAETAFWNYPKKINAWYKDHFPYRTKLPLALNYFKLKYLKQSPTPNSVAVGKNDWFYSSVSDVQDAYKGVTLYSQEELERIQQNIEERRDFVRNNGGEYFLLICPLKHMIYPENLPEMLLPVDKRNKYSQVVEHLKAHSEVPVIELYPMLMDAKRKKELYYATDTHWNQYGAYLAYRSIMEQLNRYFQDSTLSFSPLDFEFEWSVQTHGDLIEQINMPGYFTRNAAAVKRNSWNAKSIVKESYSHLKFHGPPHFWYTNGKAPNKLKIQFYRDSYAVYLIPYFSESFTESSFFWTRTFHADPIINEQPDIFIDESLARFTYFYLEENSSAVKEGAAAFRASLQ
jgi:hypothetical protein